MCFSAEASFGASAVLLPAGVYCLRAAVRSRPAYLPLAAIPVFFSAQQFAEGLVWVGVAQGHPALVKSSSLVFLFFALAFWPWWMPFSVAFAANRGWVKRGLAAGAVLGLALGAVLYLPLAWHAADWLHVRVTLHSVRYEITDPRAFAVVPETWWQLLYLAAVFSPWLALRERRLLGFCVLLAVSAAVSHHLFRYAFVSVWCCFAAVLSLQLCCVFARLEPVPPSPP